MNQETSTPSRGSRMAPPIVVMIIIAAAIAVAVATRRRQPVVVSRKAEMLSTVVTITLAAPDQAAAEAHINEAFGRIAALEQTLSAYRDDSEVANINCHAGQEAVVVSSDLFEAIRSAVTWHTKSRGAFDVTVGPLIELWRRCGRENGLPTDEETQRALALVGAGRVELDAAKRTVRLPAAGMQINLGGIGKGYCADQVAKLLKQRGVSSALIAVAGDIRAMGNRSDGRPWQVGVQDPRKPGTKTLVATLALSDRAASTSGNYERYVTIQGKRYSHIIDPRTGRTAADVPSVTVIGPDTVTTDVLGTALSVLGVRDGLALVESLPGVEALFITFDENGRPQFARTSGFARYEIK